MTKILVGGMGDVAGSWLWFQVRVSQSHFMLGLLCF